MGKYTPLSWVLYGQYQIKLFFCRFFFFLSFFLPPIAPAVSRWKYRSFNTSLKKKKMVNEDDISNSFFMCCIYQKKINSNSNSRTDQEVHELIKKFIDLEGNVHEIIQIS